MRASLPILALLSSSACGDSPASWDLTFVAPDDGAEVGGIVRLEARVSNDVAATVAFYAGEVDGADEVGRAPTDEGGRSVVPWFTSELADGTYDLIAVAEGRGTSVEASISVDVRNRARSESIPPDAVRMTPEEDAHPPILEPAFAAVFEDCEPLPGPVNTAGAEDSPYVTADGRELYTFFTPDASVPANEQLVDGVTGIYRSVLDGQDWTEPQRVHLSHFGELALDGCATIYGDELWFCTARSGIERSIDIFVAHRRDDRWLDWASAGSRLNVELEVGELHVADDGNAIYYHSGRAGGEGDADIWVTRLQGGDWGDPVNLEAVNGEYTDGWPWVSEDEDEIWFTRAPAAPEIWRSLRVAGEWQAPEKVVGPFAGEPTFDADGNLYFTHHFWDDETDWIIEADIYVCRRR